MLEKLIVKIMDKAKAEDDHDYGISQAKVLYDMRQTGEDSEENIQELKSAGEFLHKLVFYPETQKIFFAERFETKTVADYEKLFEEELENKRKR